MSRKTAYALGVLTGSLSVVAGMCTGFWLHHRTVLPL